MCCQSIYCVTEGLSLRQTGWVGGRAESPASVPSCLLCISFPSSWDKRGSQDIQYDLGYFNPFGLRGIKARPCFNFSSRGTNIPTKLIARNVSFAVGFFGWCFYLFVSFLCSPRLLQMQRNSYIYI